MTERVTVMVTGVGGGGHGEQIVKALRLGKLSYRIIGTDIDPTSSGFALVDSSHVVPRATAPDFLETIVGLCEHYGARALFHGSEPEMTVFDRHRLRFDALGIYLPVNRSHVLSVCQDKIETMSFLRSHGFDAPQAWAVSSEQDLSAIAPFPVVIKPAVGGGGSANVFIAQDSDELIALGRHLLRYCARLCVQQYVGTPAEEFTAGVLFGGDGALLNSIAVKRSISTALSVRLRVPNRTSRQELGTSLVISSGVSQGRIGRWPEVTGPCEKIALALRPNAPINIQCRLVEGRVVPFEINPRFSGTTSLRAMAGYNEPDVLVRRDVLGEAIEAHFSFDECTIMRGLKEHMIEVPPPH
jgi:carbamoyl-phosphate synthase large subunit